MQTDETRGGGEQTFAALFDESSFSLKENEVVHGYVTDITEDHVQVDVGFKSEGIVDVWEFMDDNDSLTVGIGDAVDVYVERIEDKDGFIVLSKEKADRLKVWDEIRDAYEEERAVEGRITARIKGGLQVDIIGVRAFLPGSQVDIRPVRNLESLVGDKRMFRIIKYNKRRGNIVLSHRVLLEAVRGERRAATLENLKEGMIVDGEIKNITEYGAFVDLGGIDGLLHVTDMSWGRVQHPSEMFKIGEEIKVKVLKFDSTPSQERVSLGLKQIQPDPWSDVAMRYPVGMRVSGKVVSMVEYGAFIELEPGVEAMVHVSEMSWTKRVKHPSKVVSIGDAVEAVVLEIKESDRKISLGMKQTEPNPWIALAEKYPPGSRVKGEVRNVTNFGIFVAIEEGIDGLVHISDISWTENIKNPADKYKKGDVVEAVVLDVDRDNEKFSLGIKQLATNPWDEVARKYRIGSEVKGEVVSLTDFGAFVKLETDIEGLIYKNELAAEPVSNPADVVKVGDQVSALVTRVEPKDQKISLSIKALSDRAQQEELKRLAAEQARVQKTTFGDLLKEKLLGGASKKADATEAAGEEAAGAENAEEERAEQAGDAEAAPEQPAGAEAEGGGDAESAAGEEEKA